MTITLLPIVLVLLTVVLAAVATPDRKVRMTHAQLIPVRSDTAERRGEQTTETVIVLVRAVGQLVLLLALAMALTGFGMLIVGMGLFPGG